jgi:raffinose/stachyose/melibiose transport system substrate-binding protein
MIVDDSQRDARLARVAEGVGRREFLAMAGLVAAVSPFALAACSSSGGGGKGGGAQQDLSVWYLTGSPAETKYITALSDQFGAAHKIKATVTPYDFDPINRQLKLAFPAGTGPDVTYANPDRDDQFVYQQKKWIIDLSAAAKQHGWLSRQAPDVTSYWNDQCCGGKMTGIPFDLAAVGWFYNTEMFSKHGLQAPTTFAEFESNLQALKSAGEIPIAGTGQSGYPFEQPAHALVDRDKLFALLNHDPSATFTDPGFVQALGYAQSWVRDKQYFEPRMLATSGADSNALFTSGKAAMVVTGTWNNADFVKNSKFEVGFFPMPMINTALPWTMGGYSPNNQWMISSKARSQSEAIDYVDFMLGEVAARTLWENNDIPAYRFKTPLKPNSKVQGDAYAAMGKTKTGVFLNNIGGYFTTQYIPTIQELYAGKKSPAEVAQQLQDNYKKTLQGQ